MTDSPVLFEELSTRDGQRIGRASLNAPKSLNALSLAMIQQLTARLDAWAEDPAVVAVWLEGAGDKSLCAGGDVVALYRAMVEAEHVDAAAAFATRYFAGEYRLDHRLHTYPKPLIVWGHGIVMGGGLGLLAGGGERVATEATRIAMPEITIGLYPDVAASWFLHRMPPGVGAYLGLTGAQINARDALDLGLANRLIPQDRREAVFEALVDAEYTAPAATVKRVLGAFEERSRAPEGQVLARLDRIQFLVDAATVGEATARIVDDTDEDKWLTLNRQRLKVGCPMTAHLVWQMLQRHRHSSLAEALRDELNLSVQCCRHADLAEGVRALLVDKDKNPRWAHGSVAEVPRHDIDDHFKPLWSAAEHPLRNL